ncbi:MAG: BrnA antitoxin family protein [Candidatus Binataceae bacterium]
MRKKSAIVQYTAKQIEAKVERGEDRTNWRKADAMTGKKLEASIRSDVDDVRGEPDWTQAIIGVPAPKDHINIRIDHDVLEWFKSNGRGYQTLMNNVLRAFVQSRQQPSR